MFHTIAAIPIISFTAFNAYLPICCIVSFGTYLNTISIQNVRIPWTIRTLRANKEHILIRQKLNVRLTVLKVEDKPTPCPNGFKDDVLIMIVDDESCYSIDPSIVSANVLIRTMTNLKKNLIMNHVGITHYG